MFWHKTCCSPEKSNLGNNQNLFQQLLKDFVLSAAVSSKLSIPTNSKCTQMSMYTVNVCPSQQHTTILTNRYFLFYPIQLLSFTYWFFLFYFYTFDSDYYSLLLKSLFSTDQSMQPSISTHTLCTVVSWVIIQKKKKIDKALFTLSHESRKVDLHVAKENQLRDCNPIWDPANKGTYRWLYTVWIKVC